jgi:hypothetical protein
MERVFSFDLVVAELWKCVRSPFVRGLFLVPFFAVTIVLTLFELDQNEAKGLHYPVTLDVMTSGLAFLGRLVPPIFFAWMFGHEASADTWKTILVRRPHRLPFVTAKVVAGCILVVAVFALGGALQMVVYEVAGTLAGAARFPDELARWTADAQQSLAQLFVAGAVTCAFAGSGSLVVRNNGTIIGFACAYVMQIVGAVVFSDVNDAEAVVMFTHRAVHLGLLWSGTPLPEGLEALAAYTVAGDLFVVGVWCAVPFAVAAVVFCRRDLVSGVG